MSDSDISDVNPDELNKMLEGIDFSDDDNKTKPPVTRTGKSNLKSNTSNAIPSTKKKIQFSEDTKKGLGGYDDVQEKKPSLNAAKTSSQSSNLGANKPLTAVTKRKPNTITFDDDDDILGGLDDKIKPRAQSAAAMPSKPSSSFMSDLFGSDDSSKRETTKQEFRLDDKYKSKTLPESSKTPSGISTSSLGSASSKTPATSSGSREKRRTNPTISAAKVDLDLDLDDDKLFRGTSLASKQSGKQEASSNDAAKLPWVQGSSSTSVPKQQEKFISSTADKGGATTEMVKSHQDMINKLGKMEQDQLEQFQRDLNEQKSIMESKQMEHKLTMEQHKQMCQEQVRVMQEQQRSLINQQQKQMESMMQQVQMQMESELKMKQELMRNQIHMMTEIQSQNSGHTLEMNFLKDFGTGQQKSGKLIEEQEKAKQDRMRKIYEEQIAELEVQVKNLQDRHKEVLAGHQDDLQAERNKWKAKLKLQSEEHQESLQTLKTEYTISLDRIRELKEGEEEAGVMTKNLQLLLNQVTSSTDELGNLNDKVESKLLNTLDVKETLLLQKDKQIAGLKDHVEKLIKTHKQELKEMEQNNKELEAKLRNKENDLEQQGQSLRKAEMHLQSQKRKFELEMELQRQNIESQKVALQSEKSMIQHERKEFKLYLSQQALNMSKQQAMGKLKDANNFLDLEADLASNLPPESQRDVRGLLEALDELKKQLEHSKEHFKKEEEKLLEKKQRQRDEKGKIMLAAAKLSEIDRKLDLKLVTIQDFTEACQRLRAESHSHLDLCQTLTNERAEVRNELKFQLEEFERKEVQMEERKRILVAERKKLWYTRNNLLCKSCKLPLNSQFASDEAHLRSNLERNPPQKETRTAGDGQNELLMSHLQSMKKAAKQDEEYLKQESEYLKGIYPATS